MQSPSWTFSSSCDLNISKSLAVQLTSTALVMLPQLDRGNWSGRKQRRITLKQIWLVDLFSFNYFLYNETSVHLAEKNVCVSMSAKRPASEFSEIDSKNAYEL